MRLPVLPTTRPWPAAAALAFALAGCATTGQGLPGDGGAPQPPAPDATQSPTPTSATECLLGDWEYDSAAGVRSALEAMGVPAGSASVDVIGSTTLSLDGKHAMLHYDAVQITLQMDLDGSELVELIRFDGEGSAVYRVSGDEITVGRFDLSGANAEIIATVDGQPLDLGTSTDDLMASLSSFTNAQTFTCDASTFTMTDEQNGITSTQVYTRR
ncbi:MAG: hypothetical protein KQH57_17090 [Actinomycetales bacterium]|nr:hypothetical protein [Actinomycetales bacterium]